MDPSFDKQKLVQDFANLLSQMEQAIGGKASFDQPTSKSPEKIFEELTIDRFSGYEELVLSDGRILRRYDSGAVRVENPKSGIIQEEGADGKLIISLPNGRVIFQEYRGEPLLVYDTDQATPPILARVGSATLPGEEQARFVFHFQDQQGSHLVDLETLRYYRVKRPG